MRDLTEAQRLMVQDGMPAELFLTADERREGWKGMRLRHTNTFADKKPAKDEDPATKQLRKELAAAEEAKKAARLARLKQLKQETAMKTTAKTKAPKAAGEPAGATKPAARRKPAPKGKAHSTAARTPTGESSKTVRPGSKLAIVVGLLTRPEGCTSADILSACDWPSVSVPQQARAGGLILRKEKQDGVTRYYAG